MSKPKATAVGSALSSVFTKRGWPALPQPDRNVVSLDAAVKALRDRVLVQSREAGDVKFSFVMVQDLISVGVLDASGKTLEQRVADIEKRLAAAGIP